jgi:hypothetical protein
MVLEPSHALDNGRFWRTKHARNSTHNSKEMSMTFIPSL